MERRAANCAELRGGGAALPSETIPIDDERMEPAREEKRREGSACSSGSSRLSFAFSQLSSCVHSRCADSR